MKKQPATGWRDAVALLGTAFGVFGAAAAGALLTKSPVGLFLGPAAGAFGYSKQYWRTALKRRPRLGAMPPPSRPTGDALVGTAQPFERTVAPNALAIATTIYSPSGVIVRAIESEPFWLALADRRVLIAGECWAAGGTPEVTDRVTDALRALGADDLPIDRRAKKKMRVSRVTIAPGDRISVFGRLREEQLPGGGGYRDALTEAVRGEPGAIVWIDVHWEA